MTQEPTPRTGQYYYGTGRRKCATARVRLYAGSGTIEINGRRVPTTDQLFWAGYSGMAYLPSTVAPAGFTKAGLPVGVQIIGPQYGDRTCIQMARLLEREYQGFVPPPDYV